MAAPRAVGSWYLQHPHQLLLLLFHLTPPQMGSLTQWGGRKTYINCGAVQVGERDDETQKEQESPLSVQEKKQNKRKDKPVHGRKAA